MIKIVFIIVIFSFIIIIIIVVETNNVYTQFDKFIEILISASIVELANMTDQMKFICIQMDASGVKDRIEDKEEESQCNKFLYNVSIYEMREFIERYLDKKTTN